MRDKLLLLIICLFTTITSTTPAQTPDLYDEATVRDFELTFSQPNWWSLLYQNMEDEICIEADLVVDGLSYPQVGVRFKGNSSASVYPEEKMPFKIKTDEFVADQKLYGFDTINLGNSFMDPTFCREVVTYHVLRQYMPAPKSNYVRLWINTEYWGIYVNTEQVSGEFLDARFEDKDGNRYKCDPSVHGPGTSSTLTWLGSSPSLYYNSYQLKSDPTGTEWTDLVDMIDILNNSPVANHWTTLAPSLFMDRCLWFMVGCNLFANLDSYIGSGHNYYVYNDPYEGRFNPIPWDTNEAFGNFAMIPGSPPLSPTQLQQLSPLLNYGDADYPLITKLLNPAAGIRGRQVYLAHFRDMVLADWNWTNIGGLVQQYQDLIEDDVNLDTKKLYSMSNFYNNVTQNVNLGGRTSCGLQPFVENRRTYLLNQSIINAAHPTIAGTAVSPAAPGHTDAVTITATVTVSGASLGGVSLYYRVGAGQLFQEVPMYDDGLHNDGAAGDDLFGGPISAQPGGSSVEYFILAQTTAQTVALDPIHGESAPHSYYITPGTAGNGVLINEFLAKNDTGIQDEMGEYEDWVELYNETASLIDLGGAYLTDDLTDLTKWQIPASTYIDPYGTLLIWTDNDETDGPLHTSYKLSADGEEIALVDTDGTTLLDSIVFGAQEADISTGRLYDGQEPWVTLLSPSPEALNAPGTMGFRTYSALDSTVQTLSLEGTGTPEITEPVVFETRDGPLNSYIVLFICRNSDYAPIDPSGTVLLVALPWMQIHFHATDGAGAADHNITLPNKPSLVGKSFYLQSLTDVNGFFEGSNGLEMVVGP